MSFIRNNWKFIITTTISVKALVPAWLVFSYNNKKSLSYEIQSVSPLVSEDQSNTHGLQVLFQGKAVAKPYVSIIKIINDGGVPIETKDFDGPIDIDSGDGTNILAASVLSKQPDSIKTNIETTENTVSFMPTLLNPDDAITIKIITGNVKPVHKISARISGIKSINKHGMRDNTREILAFSLLSAGAFLFGIIISILMDAHIERDKIHNICFIRSRSLYFIGIPCFLGTAIVIGLFKHQYNLGDWYFFLIMFIIIIVGEITCKIFKLHTKIKFQPLVEQ